MCIRDRLWGVAFANIVRGVPLTKEPAGYIQYSGGFWNLLNPYALLGGLTTLALFVSHGAFFLALKTDGEIRIRANKLGQRVGLVTALLAVLFLGWTLLGLTSKGGVIAGSVVVVVAWLTALAANAKGREGYAFLFSAIATAAVVITLFTGLYPNVMPNLTAGGPGLNIFNASSTHYTLGVMTWVAVVMTPIVLLYQGWSYWVFRKRINPNQISTPEVGVLDTVH